MNFLNLWGLAQLGGIGFTMSLFIGSLAFDGASSSINIDERLGIIMGSVVSGVVGLIWLNFVLEKKNDVRLNH